MCSASVLDTRKSMQAGWMCVVSFACLLAPQHCGFRAVMEKGCANHTLGECEGRRDVTHLWPGKKKGFLLTSG